MDIKNLLKNENIIYKVNKVGNTRIFEFDNETLLIVIINNKNQFKICRKDFYKIDNLLLPYAFCLIDSSKDEMYYVLVKEPNNFLRKSFENTNKEEIYFRKEILQNKIKENELIEKIKKIGEY